MNTDSIFESSDNNVMQGVAGGLSLPGTSNLTDGLGLWETVRRAICPVACRA